MIDMNGETTAELVEHDAGGGENAADFSAAFEAWKIECARVEALRLKYALDEEPWTPAAPNTLPIARPSWLAQALAAESKIRDKMFAADEVERARLAKHDVTRGEWEGLLKLLGVSISQSADVARHAAWRAHMDRVNGPHPSDLPYTAEEQRVRDEQCERSRAAMVEKMRKNDERFAREEAARAGREVLPRGSLRGTGREGFTKR
jgi:hypothetical protein